MVDRYESLIQEESGSRKKKQNSSILLETNNKGLNQLIKRTEESSGKMKACIERYRQATTAQQQKELLAKFKMQEESLHDSRQLLFKQYKNLEGSEESKEKMLIKEHLLKTVQKSLKLDVEMNELISRKQNQLEMEMKKLSPGSEKLKNALCDLAQKRDQIIYLQNEVKQCVQLLNLIGILVLENTQKIEIALNEVQRANEEVDKGLRLIEAAKWRTEKSRKRKCCIILIGLVVIIVIIGVVFGFSLKF